MTSLLEAAAGLAVASLLLALVSASLGAAAKIRAACDAATSELFAARQLEQLGDQAALAAGAGPNRPAAIQSVDAGNVVFGSDQNGDGVVDSTSSETTALELRTSSGDSRVRVRLGRQTMTVLEAADRTATLTAVDRSGFAAGAPTASLVELAIAPADAEGEPRRLLFAVPARTLP